MKRLRRFIQRVLAPFSRDGRSDITAELETHLELLIEENVRRGLSPADARREAILRLGATESIAESVHEQRVLPLLDTVPRDLRFALRRLVHEPGFAVVSILTLALAIGANTAIFSAVNAALIRPLPYPAADRLVQVWETNPQAARWGDWASYPDFEDWSRESRAFDGLALYRNARLRLTHGEYPEMLNAVRVSPGLFSVLRVDPMLGRSFVAEDGRPGQIDVAILSYGLWQRQFGSDPTRHRTVDSSRRPQLRRRRRHAAAIRFSREPAVGGQATGCVDPDRAGRGAGQSQLPRHRKGEGRPDIRAGERRHESRHAHRL